MSANGVIHLILRDLSQNKAAAAVLRWDDVEAGIGVMLGDWEETVAGEDALDFMPEEDAAS